MDLLANETQQENDDTIDIELLRNKSRLSMGKANFQNKSILLRNRKIVSYQ